MAMSLFDLQESLGEKHLSCTVEHAIPSGIKLGNKKPRRYQQQALGFLVHLEKQGLRRFFPELHEELKGGALCASSGLGKTFIMIMLCAANTLPSFLRYEERIYIPINFVVCPRSLLSHWTNEIKQSLVGAQVYCFERADNPIDNRCAREMSGEGKQMSAKESLSLEQLKPNAFLIVPWDVFVHERNFSNGTRLSSERSVKRKHYEDHPKIETRYFTLCDYIFGRLILDEGQMSGCKANSKFEMCARKLQSIYRWYQSATPVNASYTKKDLQHLFTLLKMQPYSCESNDIWNETNHSSFLQHMMWSHTQRQVASQMDLPGIVFKRVPIEFSKAERIYYDNVPKEKQARFCKGHYWNETKFEVVVFEKVQVEINQKEYKQMYFDVVQILNRYKQSVAHSNMLSKLLHSNKIEITRIKNALVFKQSKEIEITLSALQNAQEQLVHQLTNILDQIDRKHKGKDYRWESLRFRVSAAIAYISQMPLDLSNFEFYHHETKTDDDIERFQSIETANKPFREKEWFSYQRHAYEDFHQILNRLDDQTLEAVICRTLFDIHLDFVDNVHSETHSDDILVKKIEDLLHLIGVVDLARHDSQQMLLEAIRIIKQTLQKPTISAALFFNLRSICLMKKYGKRTDEELYSLTDPDFNHFLNESANRNDGKKNQIAKLRNAWKKFECDTKLLPFGVNVQNCEEKLHYYLAKKQCVVNAIDCLNIIMDLEKERSNAKTAISLHRRYAYFVRRMRKEDYEFKATKDETKGEPFLSNEILDQHRCAKCANVLSSKRDFSRCNSCNSCVCNACAEIQGQTCPCLRSCAYGIPDHLPDVPSCFSCAKILDNSDRSKIAYMFWGCGTTLCPRCVDERNLTCMICKKKSSFVYDASPAADLGIAHLFPGSEEIKKQINSDGRILMRRNKQQWIANLVEKGDLGMVGSKLKYLAKWIHVLCVNHHKLLVFEDDDRFRCQLQIMVSDNCFATHDVELFQKTIGGGVLFLDIKSSAGLNLSCADTVILCSPHRHAAVVMQAYHRAHRFGQVNVVTVYECFIKNTIEEDMWNDLDSQMTSSRMNDEKHDQKNEDDNEDDVKLNDLTDNEDGVSLPDSDFELEEKVEKEIEKEVEEKVDQEDDDVIFVKMCNMKQKEKKRQRKDTYDEENFSQRHHKHKHKMNDMFRYLLLQHIDKESNVIYLDGKTANTTKTIQDLNYRFFIANHCQDTYASLLQTIPKEITLHFGEISQCLRTDWKDIDFAAAYFDLCYGSADAIIDVLRAFFNRTFSKKQILIGYTITGRGHGSQVVRLQRIKWYLMQQGDLKDIDSQLTNRWSSEDGVTTLFFLVKLFETKKEQSE